MLRGGGGIWASTYGSLGRSPCDGIVSSVQCSSYAVPHWFCWKDDKIKKRSSGEHTCFLTLSAVTHVACTSRVMQGCTSVLRGIRYVVGLLSLRFTFFVATAVVVFVPALYPSTALRLLLTPLVVRAPPLPKTLRLFSFHDMCFFLT